MSEGLIPCGFCGGGARVIVVDEVTDAGAEEATVPLYAASCPYCGARGPMALSEDEAVEAWNRRAERTCRAEVSHGSHGPEPRFPGDVWTMHHVCSACGGPVDRGDGYCRHCGARVVGE